MVTGGLMGSQGGGLKRLGLASGALSPEVQKLNGRKKNGGTLATFLGGNFGSTTGTPITISASFLAGIGAVIGDMLIIDIYSPGAGLGGSITTTGWLGTGGVDYPIGNNSNAILWRALTFDDITNGAVLTCSASVAMAYGVYRNAPVVALLSSGYVGGTATCIVPGAFPSPNVNGLLLIGADRNQEPGRTYPPGWAVRIQNNAAFGGFGSNGRADLLDARVYAAGAPLTMTGYTGPNEHGGFLLELRAS